MKIVLLPVLVISRFSTSPSSRGEMPGKFSWSTFRVRSTRRMTSPRRWHGRFIADMHFGPWDTTDLLWTLLYWLHLTSHPRIRGGSLKPGRVLEPYFSVAYSHSCQERAYVARSGIFREYLSDAPAASTSLFSFSLFLSFFPELRKTGKVNTNTVALLVSWFPHAAFATYETL